jgi:beta-fructofuranosidase
MPDGTTFEGGMRDPFVFRTAGRTFLVVGADTETEAVVPIFEAADESLAEWTYRGILWSAPKEVMEFPECPNFFPLDGKFVLLNSPYRPVEYRVGSLDLDSLTFSPEAEGRLDASGQFYASNTATAPDGRCILFGWIRGFPEGLGWNGCLALPRELSIGPDGRPRQRPARELEALRGDRAGVDGPVRVADGEERPLGISGEGMEIRVRLEPSGSGRSGLRLRGADGESVAEIVVHGTTLEVAGEAVGVGPGAAVDLAVFVDRSVLEVFVDDGRQVVTRVIPSRGGDLGAFGFAEGGTLELSAFDAWELTPVWADAAE